MIDLLKYIMIPMYIVVFIFLLYIASTKLLLRDKRFNFFYIVLGFLFYSLIALLDYESGFLPYAGDIIHFENIIRGIDTDLRGYDQGLFAYYILVFFPKYIFFKDPNLFKIFNIFISLLSGFLIWKAFFLSVKDKASVNIIVQRIFLLMFLFYPSNINFGTRNLREVFIMFFLVLLIKNVFEKKYFSLITWTSLVFLILLRGSYIILIPIIFFNPDKFINHNFSFKKLMLLGISIRTLYGLFLILFNYKYNNSFSLNYIMYLRNHREIHELYSYPIIYWNNWGEAFVGSIKLVLQFLLYPINIIANGRNLFFGIFSYMEFVYMSLIFFPIILRYKKISVSNRYKLIILLGIVASAIFEYYFTSIIRHRYLFFNLIMPVSSCAWSLLLLKKKNQ